MTARSNVAHALVRAVSRLFSTRFRTCGLVSKTGVGMSADAARTSACAKSRRRRGNTIVEFALLMPVLLLLTVGTIQFGKFTYLYYVIKKIEFASARYLSVQQAVDFCNLPDALTAAAFTYGLTDSYTGNAIVANLTAEGDEVISMSVLRHVEADSDERAAYLRLRREKAGEGAVEEFPEPDGEGAGPEAPAPAITLSPDRYDTLARQEEFILTVSERGFGKRT